MIAEGGPEVDDEEGDHGDEEKQECGVVGGGVVEVLDLVVESDGEGSGGSGDVAAEHEDDAEFAYGVGEGEDGGGEERGAREGEDDAAEGSGGGGSEAGGGFEVGAVDPAEAGDERLYGEGKAVEDRSGEKTAEAEGEGMSEEVDEETSDGCERAEGDEEIKADDGGWKDERKGYDGLDDGSHGTVPGGDPPGERKGDHEQDGCGAESQPEGE